MEFDFTINRHPDVKVVCIGNEQLPVIVVDNLMNNPEELVEFAGDGSEFVADARDYYPGIKKPIPDVYAANIASISSPLLREVYRLDATGELETGICTLSITTTQPDELLPIQCIPHFDSNQASQFAVVHYLCPPHFGGTSFYRHRQTGYESVDASRFSVYTRTLERQATTVGLPKREYINGDTALFLRIASFAARFNRAIFYPGHLLHSGNIQADLGFSANPRTARLTATSSLIYK